jgi:hypothetical protein
MMTKVGSLVALLLLQYASLTSAQRKLRHPSDGLERHLQFYNNEEPVYGREDRFTSYFAVEYGTLFGTTDNVDQAAQVLSIAYNKLIVKFNDPFKRRMAEVQVLSSKTGRRLTQEDMRDLQSGNVLAILESAGICIGCPRDSSYSNQVLNSPRALKGQKGLGSLEEPITGPDDPYEPSAPDTGPDDPYEPSVPDTGPDDPHDPDQPYLRPGLPSPEDILQAYSAEIQKMDLGNIVDVIALDEIAEPPRGDKKKGDKKAKGNRSEGKSSKKGYKGSKDGGGKGYKGSKSGGGKGSKKSSKGCNVEPDTGETADFTSYFRSLYSLLSDSSLGLEKAAGALATAYNRLMENFAAVAVMEATFLFDEASNRRLLWEEVRKRELQGFNFDEILEASGYCIGCERQFTLSNQITGRRHLKSVGRDGESCLRPGLPTEEEVRAEYNIVLAELGDENVEECLELKEIERVSLRVA